MDKGEIYLLKEKITGLYKIGISTNFRLREKKYITDNPHGIELIHKIKCMNYKELEKDIKRKYKNNTYNNRKEWFKINEQQVNDILNYINKNKRNHKKIIKIKIEEVKPVTSNKGVGYGKYLQALKRELDNINGKLSIDSFTNDDNTFTNKITIEYKV